MGDSFEKDKQQEHDTGPQGTRFLRRESLEQLIAEQNANSVRSSGVFAGATLVGTQGAFKGKRFEIPKGRSTLGRDRQNDIVINADSVSLVHARLIEKEGQYRVLNLLSTNGTWVNNKKVSDSALWDGDSVCFGETEFLFQQNHSPARSSFGRLADVVRRWFSR